jgi:hypothetical protein
MSKFGYDTEMLWEAKTIMVSPEFLERKTNLPPRVGSAEYAEQFLGKGKSPYSYIYADNHPNTTQYPTPTYTNSASSPPMTNAQLLRAHIMSQPSQEEIDVCWFGLTLDQKGHVAFQPETSTDNIFYQLACDIRSSPRSDGYRNISEAKIQGTRIRVGPQFKMHIYTPENYEEPRFTWYIPTFANVVLVGGKSMGGSNWYNMENPILSDTIRIGEKDVTAPESILSPVCLYSNSVSPINASRHWVEHSRYRSDTSLSRVDCGSQTFSVALKICEQEYALFEKRRFQKTTAPRRFAIELVFSKEKLARLPKHVSLEIQQQNKQLIALMKSFPDGVVRANAGDHQDYVHILIQGEYE